MKTRLLIATAALFFAAPIAVFTADADMPQFRAEVICYNGKLDSGSSFTANAAKPDTSPETNGKMTCGFPGKVSEIAWSFVERRGSKDVYSFTRRFPLKSENIATETKRIQFGGERVTVFEDKYQVIVIQSPKK